MSSSSLKVLGKPLNRVEGRQKVTGRANYAADNFAANLAYACGVMSTVAAGEIVAIDTREAETSPGVIAVLHHGNMPKLHRCPEEITVGEQRPPFEDDRVYYAGQFVALVVAETYEQARRAAQSVKVCYREEKPMIALDDAIAAHGAKPKGDDNQRGGPLSAFAAAAVKIDATYTTPVQVHNAMELHATLARWEGGRLIVHDSTQWVVGQAQALAHTLGLRPEQVVVHSPFIGGGFGGKLFLWPHTTLAAVAARETNRPVKLVLDRRSEFTTAGHRPYTRQHLRIGASREGRLLAILHDSVSHTSLVHDYLESCGGATGSLYACPSVGVTHRIVPANVGTPTPMRAPGEAPGLFALESAMDELAIALGMDPLELRLKNYPERDGETKLPWSSNCLRECLQIATERFGWSRRSAAPGSMYEHGELIGWGLGVATWPAERDEATVRVELRADGTARAACATQDIGTGTYTVIAQVVAELTGLDLDRVEVVIGDSSLPPGPISGGSMATATIVPAVAAATRRALSALGEGGGRSSSLAERLRAAGKSHVVGEAHAAPGDERERFAFRSFGAHCVEVRWDPRIARLRVARIVSALDTGRIINHKTATNQVCGALVMAMGMALREHAIYDPRTGCVVTDNVADYHMPVNADTPEMDVTLLDRPDPHIGDFGARGIGEIGMTGVVAAIANAVYHATGKRIRDLPITVEKLLG